MLNKLERFVRRYDMISPGDTVVCAVSGGADSVALLFAMYLLKEKWQVSLEAAHFNHHLRGDESDRDEAFVKDFCQRFDIPLHLDGGNIVPGKKGLEAAARDARYAFLNRLPGKIATAHTADDNAETVLMHLVRGTGLKGLGAIAPVNGKLIRPMLAITRQDVEDFLLEYHLPHMEDSSNHTDQFLRNRIRRQVMPLLKQENPSLAENLSAMALRLRQDEAALDRLASDHADATVTELRILEPAVRNRVLEKFLKASGVREPEAQHIALAESLVFSDKPSATAAFPGDVTIGRNYDRLTVIDQTAPLKTVPLACPGTTDLPQIGLRVVCEPEAGQPTGKDAFTVVTSGAPVVRCRMAGDAMRFPGGTKTLKKWFIDQKTPATRRNRIPVIADDNGILGVYGAGANLDRLTGPGIPWHIRFEPTQYSKMQNSEEQEIMEDRKWKA